MTGAAHQTPRILHLHSTFDAGRQGSALRAADQRASARRPNTRSSRAIRSGAARPRCSMPRRMVVLAAVSLAQGQAVAAAAGAASPRRCRPMTWSAPTTGARWTRCWRTRCSPTPIKPAAAGPPRGRVQRGRGERAQAGAQLLSPHRARPHAALVVPSRRLEEIALEVWHQPRSRVRRIANGIRPRPMPASPDADVLPALVKRKGELWVGTLAGLRKVKNLPALVRAFAGLPQDMAAGHRRARGPSARRSKREAVRLGIEDRVHLPGFADAAAAGRRCSTCSRCPRNQRAVSDLGGRGDGRRVAGGGARGRRRCGDGGRGKPALHRRAGRRGGAGRRPWRRWRPIRTLREKIGAANRAKARAEYEEATMVERYRALYWSAMARRPGQLSASLAVHLAGGHSANRQLRIASPMALTGRAVDKQHQRTPCGPDTEITAIRAEKRAASETRAAGHAPARSRRGRAAGRSGPVRQEAMARSSSAWSSLACSPSAASCCGRSTARSSSMKARRTFVTALDQLDAGNLDKADGQLAAIAAGRLAGRQCRRRACCARPSRPTRTITARVGARCSSRWPTTPPRHRPTATSPRSAAWRRITTR